MRISRKIVLLVVTAAVLIAAVLIATVCYNNLSLDSSSKAENFLNIQAKNYIQLLFVGDLMFDRGIRYYASLNNGNEYIFDKISDLLLSNNLVIANLEGPITDNKSVSAGTAPGSAKNYIFTFDPSLAKTLFQKNIRLVNLSNNHILNFGQVGLEATQKYLKDAGVRYFGAPGKTRSIIENISGVKIGFVGYNEFGGMQADAEAEAAIQQVQAEKLKTDIVIVFCHWGVEYAKQPTETQKNLARQFVDAGADLIIGSHAHVIQGPEGAPEEYKGKRIYYSLGNFIFDQYFDEDVRNGLGVVVKIDKETKNLEFKEVNFYLDSTGQTTLK